MDDFQRVINWINKKENSHKIVVEYYSWGLDFNPPIYDITIKIKTENTYIGRGTDFNEKIAFLKAFSEAVERSLIKLNKLKSSNGVSIHFNSIKAKNNSRNELIERDCFFYHYLTYQQFEPANFKSKKISEVIRDLKSGYINTHFYYMTNQNNYQSVLCIIDGLDYLKPFGVILGSSYESNRTKAEEKSFLEAVRQLYAILNKTHIQNINLKQFLLSPTKVSNHIKLGLNPDYAKQFLKQYCNKKNKELKKTKNKKRKI